MTYMGGAIMAQMGGAVSFFCERYAQKHLSSGEYPFQSLHDHGFRSI